MALVPCRGQAHPHQFTSPLHQQPPSASGFGRDFGAARPLRLGRRAERSRRLQPCGAWAGERWSRAFAAARSRARQFLQDQQQHFQRPDADDAVARDQATGAQGDQQSSRGSSRPAVRSQASEDGNGSREQPSSSAQPQETAPVQLSVQDAEWEDWKAYMEASDVAGRELNELEDELAVAAAEERYSAAAALKTRMDTLNERDVAAAVVAQMDELLENEKYAEAATLRDEAATSVLGWFVGRGEDDPHGHLLRVSTAYNRYMGHAFSARDISAAKVAVDTGRVDPDEAETAMDGSGVPMLELFLRKEGSDGELQRKLVAVRASPVEDASSMGQQLAESLQGLEGLDSSNAVLKVEKHDGTGPVKVTLDFTGGEAASSDSPDQPEQPEPTSDDDDAAKFLQDLGFGGVVGDMSPGYAMVGGPGEDVGTFGTVEDPFSPSSSGEGDMDQGQIQLTGTVMRLDRVPAELRSVGRDTFSVHIPAPPPEPETESKAAEEVTAEVVVEPLASPTADSSTGSSKSKAATALPQLLQTMAKSGGKMVPDADQVKQILAGIAGQIDEANSLPPLLSLSGNVQYWRLPEGLPPTDPFNGMYLANYGTHGPELLRLYRESVDGEEHVIAKKLTGDTNVPAGEVTFRSKVARRHRVDHRDTYPPEFGITARYKAEGQIAGPAFSDKRWVPGELLVFSGNSPLVGPCALGFLWNIPGQRQFLVPLHRCDLN